MFNKQKTNESSIQNECTVPYYDTANVELKIIEKKKIAVLKIKSFEGTYLEKDKLKIASLFDSITEYSNVIIDIQGNGGGSSLYWSNCLIPLMIDKQLDNKVYLAIKNGKLNRSYYKSIGMKPVEKDGIIGLGYVPDEVFVEEFCIFVTEDQIVPMKNKKCKGKFYLLVNKEVFSASEGMAVFCKTTKCATVVGEKSGGDGIGFDPFLVCLPNSKIVIRYPGDMGLNPDGSSNFEMKTKPDIKIDADNNEERLQLLIEYIQKRSE
jgi:C-terminal processing protease CtpA/Prc